MIRDVEWKPILGGPWSNKSSVSCEPLQNHYSPTSMIDVILGNGSSVSKCIICSWLFTFSLFTTHEWRNGDPGDLRTCWAAPRDFGPNVHRRMRTSWAAFLGTPRACVVAQVNKRTIARPGRQMAAVACERETAGVVATEAGAKRNWMKSPRLNHRNQYDDRPTINLWPHCGGPMLGTFINNDHWIRAMAAVARKKFEECKKKLFPFWF